MLNRIAIEAALPVAQRLAERKLRVLPSEGSPLLSLTMTTETAMVENALALNSDVTAVLQERSNNDLHRLAKADIIKLASLSISRLHDMTRNVILPHIKDVVPRVQAYVSARRVEASLPYTVEMREIPAVYSNPVLRQLYERYPAASQLDTPARNLCPVELDRVKDLCKTGMAGFDEELAVILGLGNDEGYAEVQQVLSGRKGVHALHVDHLPGVLVAAQAIYGEPEPGVNLTLVEYNDLVNRLLAKTAQLIRGAQLRYEAADKAGTLYATGRDSLTTVAVMGRVYRQMLDQGLTPEALIGNEMAGRRFSQGQLIENKTVLEQIYTREMNLRSLKVQSEMTGIVRDGVRQIVNGEIVEKDLGEDMADAQRKLVELCSKIHEKCCDDLNQLITEIICEVFYPKTDALTFINLMNRVGAQMEADADPREVALMATVKYISHWQARQLGLIQA